ncbi:hypothetical protein, partial [Bradyrhizobium lablabi]|uniref:hypothetical protein n=1 Tax=Bradyrhizobium lablabi TaxID=722472 RepID=UPI001BAC0911
KGHTSFYTDSIQPISRDQTRTQGPITTGFSCFNEALDQLSQPIPAAAYGSLRSQGRQLGFGNDRNPVMHGAS